MFPVNDQEFEDVTIDKARRVDDGWEITRADSWSLFMPAGDYPAPKSGDSLRVYGRGIGFPFRGLFVNGHKVFYRTSTEDALYRDEELYGRDAADLLARWDAKKTVHTVEMGGLGPGYEQAIQIAAFEVLRALINMGTTEEAIEDSERWPAIREVIDSVVFKRPPVSELGLSGAQVGAAINLAARFHVHGPIRVLKEVDSDRRIMTLNNIRFD